MRAATADDWTLIRECYRRAAVGVQGLEVERPDATWARRHDATYHFVLDGADGLDAYALFDHRADPGGWQYDLAFRDWAALTPQGLAAVVGLVAAHGTVGRAATFRDTDPSRWSLLVPEQDLERLGGMYWAARGLALPVAVAQRGFPAGLTGEVTLAVDDDALPAAHGMWRLQVAGGAAVLERTASTATAEVRLAARAVGPLFTGFRDPWQLALAGLADGSASGLELLGAAFAGSPPTLVDFF